MSARQISSSFLLFLALLTPWAAEARIQRSAAEVLAFKRQNPCPSTNQRRGVCPGWQVDHVQPLCSGGPDTVDNMQWLSVEDHRTKTRQDVRVCRYLRKIDAVSKSST